MALFENIKKDLPNFPDKIIQNWLLPIANDYGWPPENQKWEGILLFKTVEFWQIKKWEKQYINLNKIIFSQDTNDILSGLYNVYIFDQDNSYSNIENGKLRFKNALSYLLENGNFPEPIYLLFNQNQYSIADGNHRFVAWYCASQLAKEIENAEKEQKWKITKTIQKKLKIKLTVYIPIEQEVWVAC